MHLIKSTNMPARETNEKNKQKKKLYKILCVPKMSINDHMAHVALRGNYLNFLLIFYSIFI